MMHPALRTLRRPGGGFAMVALDQRESMRDLLGAHTSDEELSAFKATAAEALAPHASAVLLDHRLGLPDGVPGWTTGTPLILAVDQFTQHPGEPVSASVLDATLTPQVIADSGAAALKFFALWRAGDPEDERRALAAAFVNLAGACDVPAILEGIVVAPDGGWSSWQDRDQAIVAAAAEFCEAGPALYKAQVPGRPDRPAEIEAGSVAVSEVVSCPWVVLSNGVPADRFPEAVRAACAGGASGFLAGRAVWSGAAASADRTRALRDDAVDRLQAIEAASVDGLSRRTP